MKGRELAEKYFVEVISGLIDNNFPMLRNKYAAGLIGYGSDVLGHDDEISRDHEWGPRCIIWLNDNDYNDYSTVLDQHFKEFLPSNFLGFSTKFKVDSSMNCLVPALTGEKGMHHIAITTVSRHIKVQLGLDSSQLDLLDWLCIPEQKLLEFTRGKVFCDPVGEITHIRKKLYYYPDPIWYFKMIYAWENINQIDIISLCAKRGDGLSARITVNKVIERIIRLTFLLNRKYCPGTMKWFSREFLALPKIADKIKNTLDECFLLEKFTDICKKLEEVFLILLEEYNKLKITKKIKPETPHYLLRGQTNVSFNNIISELQKLLPEELNSLPIHGACDQWITNDDVLILPEYFSRFKSVYKSNKCIDRSGIGDRIV